MSGELSQSELISSNVQAQELLEKFRIGLNYENSQEVDNMLNEIEKVVSLDVPQNMQMVKRLRAWILRDNKFIDDDEFVAQLKSAMECTLPYRIAVSPSKEKYLTIEELSCLQNLFLTNALSYEENKECYMAMLSIYENREDDINNCLSMYEYIMRPIASYMGNCGNYDESDKKDSFIMQNSLRNRRLTSVYSSMYSMLWNDQKRAENKMAMHRGIAYLGEIKRCVILSSFGRNNFKNKFYCNILKKNKK